MLRIAYDVVKPILSFHVCTEAEKYFQTPWRQTGDKPLPEPMMIQFTDIYVALGGNEINPWAC